MKDLPQEWYDQINPLVRRLHPPGVEFRWLDVTLKDGQTRDLIDAIEELDFPKSLLEPILNEHGESVRYRHAGVSLLRLELPAEALLNEPEGYLLVIVLAEDRMLTIRKRSMGIVEDACDAIADVEGRQIGTLGALAELGDEFLDRIGPTVRGISMLLDDAENEVEESRGRRLDRVTVIRRSLLDLDRYLDPLQNAIHRSQLDATTKANPLELEALRGLLDRANWIEHRIHGQVDRARVLADREHVLAMDDLASSTFRLSWIATIFLPLTFVTGLLGINVGGIPFASDRSGFWMVCAILGLVAVLTMAVLAVVGRANRNRPSRN